MDSEKPRSIGSIASRIACTLVGLLLLYVLSVGPALYLSKGSEARERIFFHLYRPIIVIHRTKREIPFLQAYVNWWNALAKKRYEESFPPGLPSAEP